MFCDIALPRCGCGVGQQDDLTVLSCLSILNIIVRHSTFRGSSQAFAPYRWFVCEWATLSVLYLWTNTDRKFRVNICVSRWKNPPSLASTNASPDPDSVSSLRFHPKTKFNTTPWPDFCGTRAYRSPRDQHSTSLPVAFFNRSLNRGAVLLLAGTYIYM